MRVLIVGSTEDDISYIQNKMEISEVKVIAGDVNLYFGTYARKDIALVACGISEMMAAMVTGIALELTKPYAVIHIGNVHSFSEGLKQKDLFIATRIYLSNVNHMALGRMNYGQIPGLKPFFTSDNNLIEKLKDINSIMLNKELVRGILISDDVFRTDPKQMEKVIDDHYVKIEHMVACDSSSGGVAVSCSKYNVPFVCLKVCAYELGNSDQLITRQRMGLSVQPYVGKIIAKLFEDLNQN